MFILRIVYRVEKERYVVITVYYAHPGRYVEGKMKITYDPEVDAMNIKFQSGKYSISNEIADGIIVDYTKDGRVISIEIPDASKKIPLKNIRDITIALPVVAPTGTSVANISD